MAALRQGILLNPSPSGSPYTQQISLPGTPHLISSYSSLSSSASSTASHSAEPDNYFLASSSSKPSSTSSATLHPHSHRNSLPPGAHTPPIADSGHKMRTGSNPTTSRRIRFAPLPDPRREVLVTDDGEELPLPSVFDDDDDTVITIRDNAPLDSLIATRSSTAQFMHHPTSASGAAPTQSQSNGQCPSSSLLFSDALHGSSLDEITPPSTDATPTLSTASVKASSSTATNLTPKSSPSFPALHSGATLVNSCSPTDKDSIRDWDLLTPISPNAALSAQSSSTDLPTTFDKLDEHDRCRLQRYTSLSDSIKGRERSSSGKWSTKRLFKPLFGRSNRSNSSTEDVLNMGVNPLLKAVSRESTGYESDTRLARFESRGSSSSGGKNKRGRSESRSRSGGSKKDKEKEKSKERKCDETTSITSQELGTPLSQTTSETTATIHNHLKLTAKRKTTTHSLFSSPTATSFNIFSHRPSSSHGVPMGRTQSLTDAQLRRVKSGGSDKRGNTGATGVRRGQLRMLNGRVYGARRVDPFANVRYDEPEFVEWGYGGMGSVSNTSSPSSIWSKVQSSAGVSIGATDAAPSWGSSTSSSNLGGSSNPGSTSGGSGRGADEDDGDGSGMSWVRRRREQREREREEKERVERELKESVERERERKVNEIVNEGENSSVVVVVEEEEASMLNDATIEKGESEPNELCSEGLDSKVGGVASAVEEEQQHVTTAINIPAPLPRHTHTYTHTRGSSSMDRTVSSSHSIHSIQRMGSERRSSGDIPGKGLVVGSGGEKSEGGEMEIFGDMEPEGESEDVGSPDAKVDGDEEKKNEDEDDLEGEGEGEGEGEDEDEEDEEETERLRVTVLGAGVEKISRHKDKLGGGHAHTSSTSVDTPPLPLPLTTSAPTPATTSGVNPA